MWVPGSQRRRDLSHNPRSLEEPGLQLTLPCPGPKLFPFAASHSLRAKEAFLPSSGFRGSCHAFWFCWHLWILCEIRVKVYQPLLISFYWLLKYWNIRAFFFSPSDNSWAVWGQELCFSNLDIPEFHEPTAQAILHVLQNQQVVETRLQ